MKKSWFWALFAVCSAVWLSASLVVAPSMSGEDVYIFRDAGWNLAAYGSFESAALVYSTDLTPRLNSHYTPVLPLLFAGYAAIFPRNAYSGTIFNLLVGLLAAAVATACVLRQPASRLRTVAAAAVATLAPVFVVNDRPEALGLVFFASCVAAAARPATNSVLVGLLLGITFLTHPFDAAVSALWVVALFLVSNWQLSNRWSRTALQTAVAAAVSIALIAPVALIFYSLDHDSLHRFAMHALGMRSGLGAVAAGQGGFVTGIRKSAFGAGPLYLWSYLLSLLAGILPAVWLLMRRRELAPAEVFPALAAVGCTLAAVFLFPGQRNYALFLVFLVPLGLLIAAREGNRLTMPALALLLFAIFIRLPESAMSMLQRMEQAPSYVAARTQPAFLRAELADTDPVVAVEGDSYDLFKPQFRRLIRLDYVQDRDQYRTLAAVANCYDAYHDATGPNTGSPLRPLTPKLNPAEFHLVQPDPQHMWITLMGKRLMRAQWGYGCDLYIRNATAPEENKSNGMRVNQ